VTGDLVQIEEGCLPRSAG